MRRAYALGLLLLFAAALGACAGVQPCDATPKESTDLCSTIGRGVSGPGGSG
jgi:hypothetical protein